MGKINTNEGKLRFKVYGQNRFEEALLIVKERCPHLIQEFNSIIKRKSCTQAEANLAENILFGGC